MELTRSSGILIHITSLPSPFGIGDLGPEAYEFVDFLEASGHKYWQILPLNPTNAVYSHSPYSSDSAFAGNTLLISPELLEREGKIDLQNFELPIDNNPSKVDFDTVSKFKKAILDGAFINFKKKKIPTAFKSFCKTHASWLDDYSLYKALHKHFGVSWHLWPEALRDRNAAALNKAKKEHVEEIEKIKYFQFLFFSQWKLLSDYAHLNKVGFIGDIPFYINHDSADCWANAAYFKLDGNKKPSKISGVPPDYFSETGQLWGTPVYNWKVLQLHKYDWWIERIRQNLLLFDLVRLDHFRAFSAYWEVNAGDKTAENGKWIKSPGNDFFKIVQKKFPEMPLIAEDLGSLDEPVYKLIKDFDFPGMKVLQFAFGEDRVGNTYLPFNHLPNNLVYTGTHDNNTSRGWFEKADKVVKLHFKDYVGTRVTSKNVHVHMQKMALNSVARLAIIPMQDIIGLGGAGIMNIPGTTKGNWTWRVDYEDIPILYSDEMKALNELYGRSNIPADEKNP
ncbi:4-alpha-glucanotransferase [Gillisia limnaea]|uniref:4-alpha-glucanotransferase n=1 Tax=Gillisia limnaea (strain DSM 15749 / LMG 21470 / R-8282) TaxID=865937 RepID=H2BZT8_GILLR|nr:4-alpha-glucanotransferase [Gillisia limnaea]EHQ01280.1 4-alpha-glucanotransferase [Gillisia limnaea DSM 15749]